MEGRQRELVTYVAEDADEALGLCMGAAGGQAKYATGKEGEGERYRERVRDRATAPPSRER